MNDLSGFRPFRLSAFRAAMLGGGIHQPDQLIVACQVKHLGFVDGRPSSQGALALADWLVAKADFVDRPKPASHPLQCGTTIERILAGDILPEEDFAVALAEATEGAVLPEMFGLPKKSSEDAWHYADWEPSAAGVVPLSPVAGGKAAEAEGKAPCPSASSPSIDLPPLGALGGALPPGRLFHPIADARFPEGFVLTGCGIALNLDESTAVAMRAAIEAGIDHLRAQRQGGRIHAGELAA